jgi:hypothetical protein
MIEDIDMETASDSAEVLVAPGVRPAALGTIRTLNQ